jgi:predicted ThiF/HesA family dinucleotide-utilizing enzyme
METNYTKMSSLPNTLFFIGGTLNDRNNMFDDSTVAANDLKISIASQATRLAKYGVEFNQNFAEVHTSNKVHKIAIPKAFYDQRDTDEPIICFDNAAEKYISTADAFTGNNATSKYVINNIKLDGGFGTDSDELIDYVEFKKNTSLSNNQNIATSTALLLTLTP